MSWRTGNLINPLLAVCIYYFRVCPQPAQRDGVDPSSTLAEVWRDKLKNAHRRYKEKAVISAALATEYRRLLPRLDPVSNLAFRWTLQLESQALLRYVQTLKIYTDLVVDGIAPPEHEDDSW